MPTLTPELKKEYELLFNGCITNSASLKPVDLAVSTVTKGRARYESISNVIGVPWYFIGIVHYLEGASNFTRHLHNGDPLTTRTTHVPAGRPVNGKPPFTWEFSATDALTGQNLDKWKDWSIGGTLYQLERYNGFGYRVKGINSPYLWSFSSHYVKGKYSADGIYDPELVSKQCGAAVLMRRMSEQQIIIMGELDTISRIKTIGATVKYAPAKVYANATELQTLLNSIDLPIRVDGKAGQRTSDGYYSVSGKYLQGDPRI